MACVVPMSPNPGTHPGPRLPFRAGPPRLRQNTGLALLLVLAALAALPFPARAAAGTAPAPLTPPRLGQVTDWRIEGVPAATNVFDPDVIAVDGILTEPGGTTRTIPAFWYQAYTRSLRSGQEVLTRSGTPGWRLRTYQARTGSHHLAISVRVAGGAAVPVGETDFEVAPEPGPPPRGFAEVGPDGQYFATQDGRPLALVGANTCWPGARGTYDYDTWFPAMAAGGWNWGRLWMWPNAFGLETAPGERLNYRLDRAWQLDYVLALAETHGLRMLLCLDYHGMFETEPDYWGGNNHWPRHPYHTAHGGPCASPREFFTSPAARSLYQKRLRYLVARYGARPGLFAWQFFNEIDNVYRLLDAAEVARWHDAVGTWLKLHDPWKRPVTTSLTSQSDRPELWSLPALDFAVYHSYSEPGPARRLAAVVDSMRRRYAKPVLIGEAGIDWRGWQPQSDPFLRGFRQLLWGGIASGSAGTSMSWWWESLHASNVYPLYRAATGVLAGTTWGTGAWSPLRVRDPLPVPDTLGDALPDGSPFDVRLVPDGNWGARPPGQIALANPASAQFAPSRLNAFVHGSAHPELRTPCRLEVWLGESARLVVHLNSVSQGAILAVQVDGRETFRRPLPNKDGQWLVNNEYNEDIAIPLPAGRHRVDLRNAGTDWFYFDHLQVERALPARYAGDWTPAPTATGIRNGREALLYVVAPGTEFPAQATDAALPVSRGHSLVVSNFPAGDYAALWFRTTDGHEAARSDARAGADGLLTLRLPELTDDLVGHVFSPPTLRARGLDAQGRFRAGVEGLRPGAFTVEASPALPAWTPVPGAPGAESQGLEASWTDADPALSPARFFRLRLAPSPL